ncbi:MAG: hotdog fold thioesterase [Proteobacteria bacterium]|nr:hotdog fold thioesterase [Pseudomonadota bacterium]
MNTIDANVKNDVFAKFVGIELIEVQKGKAVTSLKINENHMNGINIAHGAAVFALADYAFAAASNSHGITAVALNVSISYIKAVQCGTVLTATATEISANSKIANYMINITDEQGNTIAVFQGLAYRKKP